MANDVIGLDLSLTSTGIVVFENSIMKAHHVLSSNAKDDIHARINYLRKELFNHIRKYVVKDTQIIIEGLAFSSVGNATRNLAGLFFVSYNMIHYNMNLPITVVPPTTLKKYATGNGKAKKEDMFDSISNPDQLTIGNTYKKTKGRYDVCDAYWLASWGTNNVK